MNFILQQMTFLRYFIPLILEGNSRGVRSTVYIDERCKKYNAPIKHMQVCTDLAKVVGFDVVMAADKKPSDGVSFLVEGCSRDLCGDTETASITYITDFIGLSKGYRDSVDHILFPSQSVADYYNCNWDKNLYLGNPKFDLSFDKEAILNKYKLDYTKKALVLFPRNKHFVGRMEEGIGLLYGVLRAMGYTIIVKTRGKDPVAGWYRGDHYCEDASWFPHDTMELLEVSDIMINFDSGAIEEAVNAKVPVLNFELKSFVPFSFLYDGDFCHSTSQALDEESLFSKVLELTSTDYSASFKEKQKWITCEDSSKKILDHFSIG